MDLPVEEATVATAGEPVVGATAEHRSGDGDVRGLWEAMNRRSAITNWMIAIIAGCSALYFASALMIPFTIAVLGYLSLRPTVVRFCRLGLSRTMAAVAVKAILLGIAVTLGGLILVIAMRFTFDCFDATKPIATLLGVDDEDATGVAQLDAAIKRALDSAGIEIPFPYRTLTFKDPAVADAFKGSK